MKIISLLFIYVLRPKLLICLNVHLPVSLLVARICVGVGLVWSYAV